MRRWVHIVIKILYFTFFSSILKAQDVKPYSISLDGFDYPYPVHFFDCQVEGQQLRMAYMDVAPKGNPKGKTVVLMHGKNFGSFYWKNVIDKLSENGYRVIAPDQLGFGKSSKPDIHYTFHLLASLTHRLLDSLGVGKIYLVGHSTGGMLAARYTLSYPQQVEKLLLEDPIGLEDYRLLIPYDSVSNLYEEELHTPDEVTTQYIKAYFVNWQTEYQIYADIMNGWKRSGEFAREAKSAALTTQMIYEQPVCYEFKYIQCPVLIIVGNDDRTVVEKGKVPKNLLPQAGLFPEMAARAAAQMSHGDKLIINNCGHIPHLEKTDEFMKAVLEFFRH
jgi:pimeloyl-ACP methyl ester carboxylesterase